MSKIHNLYGTTVTIMGAILLVVLVTCQQVKMKTCHWLALENSITRLGLKTTILSWKPFLTFTWNGSHDH